MAFQQGNTFVFGEQPAASKWDQLWRNDDALRDGTGIATGAIGNTQLAAGVVVQMVETSFSAVSNQVAQIPYDDTIPQITEGFEVMTQAITPKSATNKLVIEANIYGSSAALGELIAAMFRDSTANAIAADSMTIAANGYLGSLPLRTSVTAGSTASTTFRVRIGSSGSSNTAFNGYTSGGSANRVFSTTAKSSIKITEYKV